MADLELGIIQERFADIVWEKEPVGSGELVKICDKEFGWKKTTNGVNMEPILRQNPHMLYGGTNARWPSFTGNTGYKWSYNTGNGDQGGEGEAFGHIKDHVKKATYYNGSKR